MTDDPVLRALRERRSIRRYTDDPVSREDALAILEAGRWAPSGLNNQPWRFLPVFRGEPLATALAEYTKYGHIVRGAGLVVLVFLEREAMYLPMKDHQGAGACMQNMLLAAHALGLGGVWLGEIVNHADHVFAATGLDDARFEFQAALAFGHPGQRGSADRRPLNELLLKDI